MTPSASDRRPVKVGLNIDLAGYPEEYYLGRSWRGRPVNRWHDVAAMAQVAERIGFDGLFIPDHLLYGQDDGASDGQWEAFSILAAFAAITSRIELAPLVACASFRNPALTAKMADTIDEISDGRFILGLGAGWNDFEFTAFGYPTDHKVGRLEEVLQIIHPLLREGRVDFEGTYYAARDCELRPRGPRPGGPPIMLGTQADGKRMLRLVAQYADIWNGIPGHEPEEEGPYNSYRSRHELLDAACEAVGRDPKTLVRSYGDLVNPLNRPEFRVAGRRPTLSGSAEEIAEVILRYREEGVEYMLLNPLPFTLEAIEALGPVLELLDRG